MKNKRQFAVTAAKKILLSSPSLQSIFNLAVSVKCRPLYFVNRRRIANYLVITSRQITKTGIAAEDSADQ